MSGSSWQQRVARIVTSLPEAEGFALAGGAALVMAEVVDRQTRCSTLDPHFGLLKILRAPGTPRGPHRSGSLAKLRATASAGRSGVSRRS